MSSDSTGRLDLRAVRGRTPSRVEASLAQAAVLVPVVRRDDGDEILFTRRADHLGEHPGQMSFPGGGREPQDGDLQETAMRESREEIGLRRSEIDHWGGLDEISTITDYVVTPFVGTIPDRGYEPDEREVAEVVRLPVGALTDPVNYEVETRDHPRVGSITVHHFMVDGYTVWGATGRILVQFLEETTSWTSSHARQRTEDRTPAESDP